MNILVLVPAEIFSFSMQEPINFITLFVLYLKKEVNRSKPTEFVKQRGFFKKILLLSLLNASLHFMRPEGSLLHS
jgi:hypothetical protein